MEVETLAMMLLRGKVATLKLLEASVTTKEEAVSVAIFTLFELVIWKARMPVEEATLKRSKPGRVDVP